MIRRTVENVLDFGPVEVVVVTGPRPMDIEASLTGLAVNFVHNRVHEQGHATSIAAGVSALTRPCDGVMIVLGDQPLITARHLRDLETVFKTLAEGSILVPHHRGRRGHPVIIPARLLPAIAGGGRGVARRLIDTRDEGVISVEMDSDVFTVDCDSPTAYRRLVRRIGGA